MTTQSAVGRDTLRMLREQRSFWVELPEHGFSVQMRRPLFAEIAELSAAGGGGSITIDHAVRFAIGWRDATPAHFIGPAGGNEPMPFEADLWAEWVRDEPDALTRVVQAIAEAVSAAQRAKADAGNA